MPYSKELFCVECLEQKSQQRRFSIRLSVNFFCSSKESFIFACSVTSVTIPTPPFIFPSRSIDGGCKHPDNKFQPDSLCLCKILHKCRHFPLLPPLWPAILVDRIEYSISSPIRTFRRDCRISIKLSLQSVICNLGIIVEYANRDFLEKQMVLSSLSLNDSSTCTWFR